MEKKFSCNNIVRAVDFIVQNGVHTMWKASERIRKAQSRVDDKNRLCEDIKDLVGLGDHIIKKRNCKLNTDLMYRVFRRDANRYATKQARRIKFYELVRDLYMNYQECKAHIMCSTVDSPERLPAYKKELADDAKWCVFPSAVRQLSSAFTKDSAGKVHSDFITFAGRLTDRVTASTVERFAELSKIAMTGMAVQAMVYTGKCTRMYPIVLMLTIYIDAFYHVRLHDSHGRPVPIPDNWIPIMYRIPKEPKDTTTQGETR
jgi:hypothetical protein